MPEYITVSRADFQENFEALAPSKKETQATLSQVRDERRCHRCGIVGPQAGKLQMCSRCKFNFYCSRECQVADWPEHKTKCRPPVVTNGDRGEEHTDLAMKFTTRLPACEYLINLFQTYALTLNPDLSTAETRMLRVAVSTRPADLRNWMAQGMDNTGLEVVLEFAKLESVPLSLTPAMRTEMSEAKIKAAGKPIISLLFTNGVKEFYHPSILREQAVIVAAKRPPLVLQSAMFGDSEIPFSEEALRDSMNHFILMDKKNQFKLRAIQK